MLKGANAAEVIKDVKTRMATIRKTLPEGVTVEPFLDRSDLVGRAIRHGHQEPAGRGADCDVRAGAVSGQLARRAWWWPRSFRWPCSLPSA